MPEPKLELGGSPLYVQIANSLLERVRSGNLSVGDRLPSERQLAEELQVSRMTVRQALQLLRERGMIEPHQGRGSFVREPKIEQQTTVLEGFFDSMVRKGLVPGARVILAEQQVARRPIAEALQLELGQPVYYVHRVRLADGTPRAIEHSYFPASSCPGLPAFDLEQRSIYGILREEYRLKLARALQTFESIVAGTNEAELLQIDLGAPLTLIERTTFDDTGTPVEYARDLYRGDSFRFVSDLQLPG